MNPPQKGDHSISQHGYLLAGINEGSEEPADSPKKSAANDEWGSSRKDAQVLARFRHLLAQTDESNRQMLLLWRREWRSTVATVADNLRRLPAANPILVTTTFS